MFLRVRCLTAARLEEYGHSTLLNYGFITILGQILGIKNEIHLKIFLIYSNRIFSFNLGGFLIFLLVNILSLFKDMPKCAPINFCD